MNDINDFYKANYYDRLITWAKHRYQFALQDIVIDIVHGYGNTAYKPLTKSIAVYIDTVHDLFRTHEFKERFGHIANKDCVCVALLHEIGHVHQAIDYGPDGMLEKRRTDWDFAHQLEKDADRFALEEFYKYEKELDKLVNVMYTYSRG